MLDIFLWLTDKLARYEVCNPTAKHAVLSPGLGANVQGGPDSFRQFLIINNQRMAVLYYHRERKMSEIRVLPLSIKFRDWF
jgi:hypothetical protein